MIKQIFIFLLGIVSSIIISFIVYYIYESNRVDVERINNAQILNDIYHFRESVDKNILNNKPIAIQKYVDEEAKKISPGLKFLEINEEGVLFIKTANTLITLRPILENGNVSWRCLGGDDRYISASCR